ncbi:hypothetical protein WBJ53_03130 [Spirosoma sp. SC4-14]|uniref:hypothetical protein n=1 Tax=Spirosoma sp. SC4-14 TaxID=3128900 RepID=UPI0030CAC885
MFRLIFFVGCFLISLAGCQKSQAPKQLTPAFYHWKAVYDPGPAELKLLQQLKVRRLYVRLFDVDWDAQRRRPVPKAIVRFAERPAGVSVIPVVFITNRTLLALPETEVATLARNVAQKIQQIASDQNLVFPEVQLDCDWSPSSRSRYFTLLSMVKVQMKKPVSATIRLHQIKYADRTGIPPVDRGMLMFYNMADWKEPNTRNSILDLDVSDRYIGFVEKYPLPLDVVLPLFRWTLVYRNDRFLTILNNIDQSQLMRLPFLSRQTDSSRFVSVRDTIAFGLSVRKGDLFRAEACGSQVLTRAKSQLLKQIPNQSLTFALYHLDSTVLAPYNHDYLQTLFAPISPF